MESNTHGAKIQKDGRTYAIQTYIPAGIVRPEDLEQIAHIAKKYKIPTIKITSGQRVLLIGVEENDIGMIREELGQLGGGMFLPGVRIVQSCPGNAYCKNGTQVLPLPRIGSLKSLYRNKTPCKVKNRDFGMSPVLRPEQGTGYWHCRFK